MVPTVSSIIINIISSSSGSSIYFLLLLYILYSSVLVEEAAIESRHLGGLGVGRASPLPNYYTRKDAASRAWIEHFALNLIEESRITVVSVYFLSVRKDSVC